ncbi:tyrosine-protein phosphatase [Geodermatophilus sp. SYSU D00814]
MGARPQGWPRHPRGHRGPRTEGPPPGRTPGRQALPLTLPPPRTTRSGDASSADGLHDERVTTSEASMARSQRRSAAVSSARVAAVVTALARTAPGGVLFHCAAGRDRTGLVTLLLLALADVEPEAVAEDYTLSVEPLRRLAALLGRPDEQPALERVLTAHGTTARSSLLATLEELDVASYLTAAGVSEDDLATLRDRLVA